MAIVENNLLRRGRCVELYAGWIFDKIEDRFAFETITGRKRRAGHGYKEKTY